MRIDKITTPPTEKYLNIKISKNLAFPFVFFFPVLFRFLEIRIFRRSVRRIAFRYGFDPMRTLSIRKSRRRKKRSWRGVFEGGRKLRLAGHVAVVDPRVGTTDKEIGGRGRGAWYAREIARRGNVVTARSGPA